MGTITLKVPQDIQLEYQIDNAKMAVQLLEWLKHLQTQSIEESSIPSTTALNQWESKAQENLTRHNKTGLLPDGLFDFD
ncbi:hypothetical protein [Candidatus Marithrix sp. Canyon 246]|uniref:hypothetical protein n=1 Tax=Candidatus Marithrix sp. Canyon 246 TaxID=1827136 RepID=UPI00084A1778|nr:hypothetical protein [Candidatus Marithrix sp. Canyon 246]